MAKQRVIGYTRVSTAEQIEGFGLSVQEQRIRAYCKAEGLNLVAMLSDLGQSGSNGLDDRLGLAEGLARIEKGDASALVVYRLDRLARDLLLQETIHTRLESGGASVVSVTEPAVEGDDRDPHPHTAAPRRDRSVQKGGHPGKDDGRQGSKVAQRRLRGWEASLRIQGRRQGVGRQSQ